MEQLGGNPQVRWAVPADVGRIVAVHLRSFRGFFLSSMGPAFLHQLYAAILQDPTGIEFVAVRGDEVLGFVAGTSQSAGFYRRLIRRRWWRFALASMPAFLRRPWILRRLARAFAMPEQAAERGDRGTLMSIAVDPQMQGRGIGKALVVAFLQAAYSYGASQVDLTTDHDGNEAVNRFYQNLGFVRERVYSTPEGRVMNEYVTSTEAVGVGSALHRELVRRGDA